MSVRSIRCQQGQSDVNQVNKRSRKPCKSKLLWQFQQIYGQTYRPTKRWTNQWTRSARSVQGKQGQPKVNKVNPRSVHGQQGHNTDRKVNSKSLMSVKGQQGQSKVSPSSIQDQSKVSKVNPMSTRSIQGQERPVKVSYCHNFNKSRDRPTNQWTKQRTDKVRYRAAQGS